MSTPRIVVTGTEQTIASTIAGSLAERAEVERIETSIFLNRSEASRAIGDAASELGGVDAMVHGGLSENARLPTPFDTLTADDWTRSCDAVVLSTLWFLQAAFECLHVAGGRIVIVVPSVALTGGVGHTAASAAGEGQRALLKSAARQWGRERITVNCLAVALERGQGATGMTYPALASTDVGALAWLLCSPWATTCTGQTLMADDGTSMLP